MLQPGRAVPSSGLMKIWLIYFAHLESVWIISVNIGHGKWGLGTYRAIWIIWAVQESSSDLIQEALQGENAECLSGSSEVANHGTNQWLETDLKCLYVRLGSNCWGNRCSLVKFWSRAGRCSLAMCTLKWQGWGRIAGWNAVSWDYRGGWKRWCNCSFGRINQ